MPILEIIFLSTFAGLISGMTGIGGGVIFTPLFKMLADRGGFVCQPIDIVNLSLLAVLLTNFPGLLFSSKNSLVPWRKIQEFFIPLVIGIVLSQGCIHLLTPLQHDFFLCLLIGYVNYTSFLGSLELGKFLHYKKLIGLVIGFLSGVAGIGGSLFFIPLWDSYQLNYRQRTAANTVIVLLVSLSVSLFALIRRWQPPIDIGALTLVLACAMTVNFVISFRLGALNEHIVKIIHKIFFVSLLFFYIYRVLSDVFT